MAEETQKQQTTSSGYKYSYEELNGSRIRLTIDIPALEFKKEEEKAFRQLSQDIKIQGFRPGKAPEQMLRAQLGASPYEKALNELLPKATLEAVESLSKSENKNMSPIDNVSYELAKVQPSAGIKFSATYTIFPIVKLGDLSKITVKQNKLEVSKEEIDKVINQIFEDWKKQNETKSNTTSAKDEVKIEKAKAVDDDAKTDDKTVKTDKDEKEGNVDSKVDSKTAEPKKDAKEDKQVYDKPTDEWVAKEVGLEAKTVAELEKLVESELMTQKKYQEDDRIIDEMMDKIIGSSIIDVPENFIQIELDNEEKQYRSRIENVGLSVDDFLKGQKTTMPELRKTWEPNVVKRIKIDLILLEVSRLENITVNDDEVNHEISHITDEATRKRYETEEGKRYIRDIKLRQKSVKAIKSKVKIEKA